MEVSMEEIIGRVVGLAPSGKGVYITILAEDGIDMTKAVDLFIDKLGEAGATQVFAKKKVSIKVVE